MVRFTKAAPEIRRSPTKAAGCVFALKSAADRPPDFDPTGKSVGVVISCLAPLEKIFCFVPDPNQFTDLHRPVPLEGRIAIVTDAGRDAVDAAASGDVRGWQGGSIRPVS